MVDVTVRGAGIFGLSVAWACLKRGAAVRVVDPNGIAAGASGGVVGALAPHVPENWNEKKAFQFESLVRAERFWREVDEISGLASGYGRLGRIQPVVDERSLGLAEARSAGAATLWEGRYTWQVSQDPGAFPVPSPTGWYIHDTLSARIHPRDATHSLAAALLARGGEIVEAAQPCGAEVWASGVHDLQASGPAERPAMGNGVKGQAAVLKYNAPNVPQVFAQALHIVPHANGTVAIGSTSERDYDDPSRTDGQLDDVIAKARTLCPVLAEADVIERWAGVRPRATSRAPLLGHHPFREGAFIANGGFKIGFGVAPKVGEVMADLILEGKDKIPESFRP